MLQIQDHNEIVIDKIVKKSLESQVLNLYFIKHTHPESEVIKVVKTAVENIINWLNTFSTSEDNIFRLKYKQQVAIEQEINSQEYGIKGKIDSTVLFENQEKSEEIIAVELKTGKYRSPTYRGQVILYNILLDSIFECAGKDSFLVYIMHTENVCEKVKTLDREIRPLLQNRNMLARYVKNRLRSKYALPPMHRNASDCDKCFSRNVWTWNSVWFKELTYSKEKPDFQEIKHLECVLDEKVKEYYIKWISAIHAEQIAHEEESHSEESKLFYKSAKITGLTITSCKPKDDGILVILRKSFDKSKNHYLEDISEGNSVAISPNNSTLVFTMGAISRKRFYVQNDGIWNRVKSIENEEKGDWEFIVKFPLSEYVNMSERALGGHKWDKVGWEMQKEYPSMARYSIMRGNVFTLCSDMKKDTLRKIIIQNEKVDFIDFNTYDAMKKKLFDQYTHIFKKLNKNQQDSIIKSICSNYYHLIMGGAGTGKILAITYLLYILNDMKRKVLLISHSNGSLDNLLWKLRNKSIPFIRITNTKDVVNTNLCENIRTPYSFTESYEIDDMLDNHNIYATTSSDLTNKLLNLVKPFDYVIIHEANRIWEPEALGAILISNKFIMFGDYYILNPTVKSTDNIDKNYSMSLFQRLFNQNTLEATWLTAQYRMNIDILNVV
jgi:hypothetical protein